MAGTEVKWPEPNNIGTEEELRSHLNELTRSLRTFDAAIFSQESGTLFEKSRKRPFTEVSATYTMGQYDSVVLADSSGGTFSVTLPLALEGKGTFYDIKKIDTNGATVVSVEGSGDELPVVLSGGLRPSVTLFSDGNNFWII